jgi:hypothetical protein
MSKILSTIGIILVVAGTIFSLWSILGTKGNYVQTADWYDHQQENFRKDKRKVIIGTISIIIGSTLQIIGLFI